MWLISAKKSYNCFICAKPFRGPSALKHHFKIHIDVRAFSCNLCPISFASKTQPDNHIRMYTGYKAFLCNSYGHCFITRGQLELHKMNRHAGVRQFGNCPEVGYCAQALGYIDFRFGWVGFFGFCWVRLVWVLLCWVGWVDSGWVELCLADFCFNILGLVGAVWVWLGLI